MNAANSGSVLFERIVAAVRATGCDVIVYRTEWNGRDAVIPTDHWLECDGERIDLSALDWDWGEADLDRMEANGTLVRLRRFQDPSDRFESSTWYTVVAVPGAGPKIASSDVPDASTSPDAASERRDRLMVSLFFADLSILMVLFFAAIGLPPNPLGDVVQDWFWRRESPHGGYGVIGSETIFWFSFVGVVVAILAQFGIALVVAVVTTPWRKGLASRRARRVRETMPTGSEHAPAHAARLGVSDPHAPDDASRRSPEGVSHPWGFYERRTALAMAILTPAVFGAMLVTDTADERVISTAAILQRGAPPLADLPRHVMLRAKVRRDLLSAIREHTSYHGKSVDTRTTFSGVRTDFATPLPDDEMFVPLTPVDGEIDEPLALFWRITRSADPSLYPQVAGASVAPNDQPTIRGTLHHHAIPLFVVNSYGRAGISVASDYFSLEPELSAFDRSARRVAVLVIGWGLALLLLVWQFFTNPARRRTQKGSATKAGSGSTTLSTPP